MSENKWIIVLYDPLIAPFLLAHFNFFILLTCASKVMRIAHC